MRKAKSIVVLLIALFMSFTYAERNVFEIAEGTLVGLPLPKKSVSTTEEGIKAIFCSKNNCMLELTAKKVEKSVFLDKLLKELSSKQGLRIHENNGMKFIQMPMMTREDNGKTSEVIHWTFVLGTTYINATLTVPEKSQRSEVDGHLVNEVVNYVIKTLPGNKS